MIIIRYDDRSHVHKAGEYDELENNSYFQQNSHCYRWELWRRSYTVNSSRLL